MPSSLTRFHSRALVYSTHPPVSVYGTGGLGNNQELFLGPDFEQFSLAEASPSPCGTATFNRQLFSIQASLLALTRAGAGILNLLSIVYALRPRLRSRLTLRGRTLLRKPWVYGERELHPLYRYSCLHSHLSSLHGRLPSRFDAMTTLPYHSIRPRPNEIRSFGIPLIANHFRREITR